MSTLFPGVYAGQLGYNQITDLSDGEQLDVPKGTQFALVQAEAENIRWRADDVVPTASVGMVLTAGGEPQGFTGAQIRAAMFTPVTGGAILNVSYFG